MPLDTDQPYEQVLTDYVTLEPDASDSWNPLRSNGELAYRLAEFAFLTQALRCSALRGETLRIVDVGCGNGRSTRMYLDLGFSPDQISGFDLRPNSVALARHLNPAIRFLDHGGTDFPPSLLPTNWVSCSTVFSSIRDKQAREDLAGALTAALSQGGYFFWFDLIRANDFAGGDELHPENLFGNLEEKWRRRFSAKSFLPARLINPRGVVVAPARRTARERLYVMKRRIVRRLTIGTEDSHEVCLYRKPAKIL